MFSFHYLKEDSLFIFCYMKKIAKNLKIDQCMKKTMGVRNRVELRGMGSVEM